MAHFAPRTAGSRRHESQRSVAAAQAAYRLGMLVDEADMKEAFERPALMGLKLCDLGRRGGETSAASQRGAIKARDIALAREFMKRRQKSNRSDTALMAEIGAKKGLKRSSANDAMQRGLNCPAKGLNGRRAA